MGKTPIDRLLDQVQWVQVHHVALDDTGGLPFVTHEGILHVLGERLKCYQLSDGHRVLDADDVTKFFAAISQQEAQ